MDRQTAQLVVRELITETDQLSRLAYVEDDRPYAEHFAALRTSLQRIDKRLGARARFGVRGEIDLLYQRLLNLAATARGGERERLALLVTHAARLRPTRRSRTAFERASRVARRHATALRIVGGGLASLGVVAAMRPLRRSRAARIAGIAMLLASIGAAFAIEQIAPRRSRPVARTLRDLGARAATSLPA